MENESINVTLCFMCFHDHTEKCTENVIDGITCDCVMDSNVISASNKTTFTETFQILEKINQISQSVMIQVGYLEIEKEHGDATVDTIKNIKTFNSQIYTLSTLFNSLVTPDLGDEHSPRSK